MQTRNQGVTTEPTDSRRRMFNDPYAVLSISETAEALRAKGVKLSRTQVWEHEKRAMRKIARALDRMGVNESVLAHAE